MFYDSAHLPDLTHINNKEDVVPILPGCHLHSYDECMTHIIVTIGRFLGFQHPHGEVHINDDNTWNACAGE